MSEAAVRTAFNRITLSVSYSDGMGFAGMSDMNQLVMDAGG